MHVRPALTPSRRTVAQSSETAANSRAIASDADDVARVGPLEVDTTRRIVRLHGEVIDLTYTQFELLQAFAQSPRRVFSRVELANRAKGGEASIDPRSINAHVQALRRKLATRDGAPEVIRAVPGVGYALDPPPDW
jgi:DNA-binding response OmpR family regulator